MSGEEKNRPAQGYNTIMGNVDPEVAARSVSGFGNTIVGSTDDRGNTRLDKAMSVGFSADGGEGGIAIGALAGRKTPSVFAKAEHNSFINVDGATANGYDRAFEASHGSGISAIGAKIETEPRNKPWFREYITQIAAGLTVAALVALAGLLFALFS